MNAWLLSIVGIVCVGILIEIIMPEGEHSKYIKGIFAIVVIFVIISPLPKLINNDSYDIGNYFDDDSIDIDQNSYDKLAENYHNSIKSDLAEVFDNNDIDCSFILYFDENYVYKIDKIQVNLNESNEELKTQIQKLINQNLGNIQIIWS